MAYIDQLIGSYGYAAIFILLALGLFSLPIPDELMVLLVGYFTKIGYLHYSFSLVAIRLPIEQQSFATHPPSALGA